jgi:electron transport complex protein RnfD
MSNTSSQLVIATPPFAKRPVDTPSIMRHVIYALTPAMIAAVVNFGISALLLILVCAATCMLAEWLSTGRGPLFLSPVGDGSAALTGILLALTLPPGLPLWMAVLGSLVAMFLGKLLFGGLGQNVFNPSLTGRAFLQASFPVAITTWAPNMGLSDFWVLRGDTFALPFTRPAFDGLTAATPLAHMKFEGQATEFTSMLYGTIPGSLGETSALLLLLGGAYLAWRGFLNWRVPVGIFATVFIFASALHYSDPSHYPVAVHHLLAGGLVLGAVFMATDPVSSPLTPLGSWMFAAGIGVLVVLIRQFGGLPEGVMYAILLMNAASPLIDRVTQPGIYGATKPEKEAKKS